jgi:sensor histidine kinase YesM
LKKGSVKKRITVKQKIMLIFSASMLILFLLLYLLFFRLASAYANDMSKQYMEQSISIVQQRMEDLYRTYSYMTSMLYHMESIDFIGNEPEEEMNASVIANNLNSLVDSARGVQSAYLQTEHGLYNSQRAYQDMDSYISDMIHLPRERMGRLTWLPMVELNPYTGRRDQLFIMARVIYNNRLDEVGSLWLIVDPSVIVRILTDNSFLAGSHNYIITQTGEIAYTDTEQPYDVAFINDLGQKRINSFEQYGNLYVYSTSTETQWTCLSIAPRNQIINHLRIIVLYFIIFAAFCIILIFVLFKLLDRIVFSPLNILVHSVDQVAEGHLDTQISNNYVDDMGNLVSHFNFMVTRISELLTEVKEQESEKNNYRMRALLMQMSPHFIYNTLNTIKWIAVINRQDQIAKLIDSLIQIFKSMSNKTDENNTVGDEIKLMKSYIRIQRARYSNFNVYFDIQDGAEMLPIRRFLLQPILENAIIHGVKDKPDAEINIMIKYDEECLFIDIVDNGVGFLVENGAMKQQDVIKNYKHIGVENVQQMIKLEHGDKYGISITSEPGKGTHVAYLLPIIINSSPTNKENEVDKNDQDNNY